MGELEGLREMGIFVYAGNAKQSSQHSHYSQPSQFSHYSQLPHSSQPSHYSFLQIISTCRPPLSVVPKI